MLLPIELFERSAPKVVDGLVVVTLDIARVGVEERAGSTILKPIGHHRYARRQCPRRTDWPRPPPPTVPATCVE